MGEIDPRDRKWNTLVNPAQNATRHIPHPPLIIRTKGESSMQVKGLTKDDDQSITGHIKVEPY